MTKPNTKLLSVTFITLVASTITAIACSWDFLTEHSVRFNSMRTGRGFYRLPPLPLRYDQHARKEQTAAEVAEEANYSDSFYEEKQSAFADAGKVWEKTMAASEAGDISGLSRSLREYLETTKYPHIDNMQQERRNTAIDLLDALAEIQHGSEQISVLDYVRARFAVHNRVSDAEKSIPENIGDENLKDNWAYLRAAMLYNSGRKEEALAAFRGHEAHFAQTEKYEAVRYMIGRIMIEQSHAFSEHRCGIEGKALWGKELDPAEIEDPKKCRDKNWSDAIGHFKRMIRKNPNGRYSNDARGWIAFLYKRGGQRSDALAEYYRLLGQTKDAAWRLEAKKSIQMIGHEYSDETLDRVEALIADEPEAALAYAYHRIYNHAIDFTYEKVEEWCCTGENRWSELDEETKRVNLAHETGSHELERIANFSTTMVKRHGRSRVSGDFLLRVAQAQLELQNFKDAFQLATQALTRGLTKDSRAQALWVKGSVEHQQKKLSAARATFLQLIREFPDHKLTEGARRLLAITAEDQNDMTTALEQYLELNYDYDVAYFVDVLMPVDQLARFVESHQSSKDYNFLLYSLGVRYMRDRKWADARETLNRVVTKPLPVPDSYTDGQISAFAKEPKYWDEHNRRIIRTVWVMRDLQTIEDLERLETAATADADAETKAEAMYQLASYQYDADELLFYNPAAWEGLRHRLLFEFSFGDHMRLPGEPQEVFKYSKSHETLARAIPIYLDIVDRYPDTRAAKDALYSAVIAHEKLSNLNPYWRDVYAKGFFAGQRLVENADIRRMFPKFKWPLSRLEWEASTRTVNGGPAWAPPPKPLPRLSRAERAQRKLKGWYEAYTPAAIDTLRSGSQTIIDYATAYLYAVLLALIGSAVWANRGSIYQGPIKNGYAAGIVVFKYLRHLWLTRRAAALPRLSLLYLLKSLNDYVKGHIKKP